MPGLDAMRLIGEELTLDGDPQHNLATFVTTWMEPEAQRIIAENLHRNFIDHAEYPRTAEIEQRCIRMLADLFHAPGETTGARTQGSSEAIMLGALSLKWNWRKRREAAGRPVDRPNLVFGGDVHVVWEKFCRYFDVEPRIVPLAEHKYTIGPEDVEPHVDENTIGVAAVLGTTFTGHMDDIVGINKLLAGIEEDKGLHVPLHVDGASGGFVWPFLYPDSEWDFRLSHVRSINVSGHKYGLVYPGIGWLIFRETADLNEDLVFYENYLGKTDATFTLNFSTGSAMVLGQYYNLIRYGREGYTYIMENMQKNAAALAEQLEAWALRADRAGRGAASAGGVQAGRAQELRRVRHRVAAGRRARLDGARLHPPARAQHVKVMRALVKETLSREMVDTLAGDIAEACRTLDEKGAPTSPSASRSRPRRDTDLERGRVALPGSDDAQVRTTPNQRVRGRRHRLEAHEVAVPGRVHLSESIAPPEGERELMLAAREQEALRGHEPGEALVPVAVAERTRARLEALARPGRNHQVVVNQLPPNRQRHPGVRARAAGDPEIGMEPERDRKRSVPGGRDRDRDLDRGLRQHRLVSEPVGEREQPERLVRRVPLEPSAQAGAVFIGARLDDVPLA